jgi:hypothetical protein
VRPNPATGQELATEDQVSQIERGKPSGGELCVESCSSRLLVYSVPLKMMFVHWPVWHLSVMFTMNLSDMGAGGLPI